MISKYDFQIVVDLYIASFIKVNTGAQAIGYHVEFYFFCLLV